VEKTMAINVIGPVMLSKELAPLMKTKRSKDNRAKSVIANLSARVGSIADNELGGWYSYRFSKAALNQATRTMAHELKRQGTWSVALHPGTTNTDMSKPFQKNVADGRLFPVDFTATQLLDVIDSMEDVHSGGLYDWAGKALPF
jgi:NAD(P)-dependent dehydrogenase (short-subunit alcohol dehydrogenase family)